MPRIAFINQDRGIAPHRNKGAAVHLRAMREAFAELGCDVMAFDQPDDAALRSALSEHGGQQAFDVVYERYALGKDSGARFARDSGIPLILEVNAPLADEQARFRQTHETESDRAKDRFLFGQADCVAAVSNSVAEYARARGARKETVVVHRNGIDTRRFNSGVDGTRVRKTHVPDGAFVVGFHGRLRPWHGFDALVSAFTELLKQDLNAHLLVVGEGDFSALAALPGAHYTQLGWQPHELVPEFVAAFDVLPLTYQPEVPCYFSPLKLMEAMACCVVPVAPDLGDLAVTIDHGNTGYVYRAGDTAEFRDLLARLARDPELRAATGRRASEYAMSHSWVNIASSVLELTIPGFSADHARSAGR